MRFSPPPAFAGGAGGGGGALSLKSALRLPGSGIQFGGVRLLAEAEPELLPPAGAHHDHRDGVARIVPSDEIKDVFRTVDRGCSEAPDDIAGAEAGRGSRA